MGDGRRRAGAGVPGLAWRTAAAGLALGAALALGGCAAPGTATEAEPVPVERARVESAVKLALIEAEDVDAAAIGVVADDARVVLEGFVASAAEREAALRAARTGAGGLEVVDELEVRE